MKNKMEIFKRSLYSTGLPISSFKNKQGFFSVLSRDCDAVIHGKTEFVPFHTSVFVGLCKAQHIFQDDCGK